MRLLTIILAALLLFTATAHAADQQLTGDPRVIVTRAALEIGKSITTAPRGSIKIWDADGEYWKIEVPDITTSHTWTGLTALPAATELLSIDASGQLGTIDPDTVGPDSEWTDTGATLVPADVGDAVVVIDVNAGVGGYAVRGEVDAGSGWSIYGYSGGTSTAHGVGGYTEDSGSYGVEGGNEAGGIGVHGYNSSITNPSAQFDNASLGPAVRVSDEIEAAEIASPGAAPSGYASIYPKADGSWYGTDDAGAETKLSNDAGFTSFNAGGDTGSDQTITNGNTLDIFGGTNGIDTVGTAPDAVVVNVDLTEIGDGTFGDGTDSEIDWVFAVTGTDPSIGFTADRFFGRNDDQFGLDQTTTPNTPPAGSADFYADDNLSSMAYISEHGQAGQLSRVLFQSYNSTDTDCANTAAQTSITNGLTGHGSLTLSTSQINHAGKSYMLDIDGSIQIDAGNAGADDVTIDVTLAGTQIATINLPWTNPGAVPAFHFHVFVPIRVWSTGATGTVDCAGCYIAYNNLLAVNYTRRPMDVATNTTVTVDLTTASPAIAARADWDTARTNNKVFTRAVTLRELN